MSEPKKHDDRGLFDTGTDDTELKQTIQILDKDGKLKSEYKAVVDDLVFQFLLRLKHSTTLSSSKRGI